MIVFAMNKKAFIKSRLQMIGTFLISTSLLFLLSFLVLQNLLADINYQKYLAARNTAQSNKQLDYIINALSFNKSNPEYLYECGKSMYELKTRTSSAKSITSQAKIDAEETSLTLKNLHRLERWMENSNNPDLIPLSLCEDSLRNNPLNAEAYLIAGLMYAELSPSDNNDDFFNMACIMDANNISNHYSIGTYYLWNWNLEKALEEFRKIFAIANSSGMFLSQYYNNILQQASAFNSEYTFLAKINPSSYKAFLSLATFLKNRNEWHDSKQAYCRAIKLAPLDAKADVIYRFALACRTNNDVEEILRLNSEYQSTIASNGKINKLFNLIAAKALYTNKEYEEAINKAEYLIGISPHDHEPYLYKGLSLIKLGEKADGIYYMAKAAQLKPDNINIRLTLATSYESVGQLNSAINEWQHILQLAKNDTKYSSYYSRALNNIIRLKTKQQKGISLP
jgi:hypothetical protein